MPSISSTVSTVTPDKLRSSILILRQGAEEFKRAQYILIQLIEDEKVAQSITLQGINGLNVQTLRRQLQEAMADSDDLLDAAEEVAERLEDQDLDDEDLEDVPQPRHQEPGAGQNNTATGAPGGAPGRPTPEQQDRDRISGTRDGIDLAIRALQETLLKMEPDPACDAWIKAKRSEIQHLELRATKLGECILDFERLHTELAPQVHQTDSNGTTNSLLKTAAELRMRINLLPIRAAERTQEAQPGTGPLRASRPHQSSTPFSREPPPTDPRRHLFAAGQGAGLGLVQSHFNSSGPALSATRHQGPTGSSPTPTLWEELPTGGQPPGGQPQEEHGVTIDQQPPPSQAGPRPPAPGRRLQRVAPTHVLPPQCGAAVIPGGQKDGLGGVQVGL